MQTLVPPENTFPDEPEAPLPDDLPRAVLMASPLVSPIAILGKKEVKKSAKNAIRREMYKRK